MNSNGVDICTDCMLNRTVRGTRFLRGCCRASLRIISSCLRNKQLFVQYSHKINLNKENRTCKITAEYVL